MSMNDIITEKLTGAFTPESLRVVDESHQHEGHAGHRPGGETHFRVYIVSQAFNGKSRIERHRMINATLASELPGSVPAPALRARAPGEGKWPRCQSLIPRRGRSPRLEGLGRGGASWFEARFALLTMRIE